jgi:dUTP pyrophosphatase
VNVKIKKLSPDAVIPRYATLGAAGFDLVAVEDVFLLPGETKLVKTGLSVELPMGFEMQVRPRSGTSLKTPLRVANAPGTVDCDYRGEVCVIMTNTTEHIEINGSHVREFPVPWQIKKGERIAQGVICAVEHAEFVEVDDLSVTGRGTGGFGSTGV